MVILLCLVLVRLLSWSRRRLVTNGLVLAFAAIVICSNAYFTVRNFDRPWRGYFGQEALAIVRSPYASGGSRLGMMESGRLGFLYPTHVVNLDGKMNVEALHALQSNTLNRYLQRADLDFILLHDFDVAFFDEKLPSWRESYSPVGDVAALAVFARKPVSR